MEEKGGAAAWDTVAKRQNFCYQGEGTLLVMQQCCGAVQGSWKGMARSLSSCSCRVQGYGACVGDTCSMHTTSHHQKQRSFFKRMLPLPFTPQTSLYQLYRTLFDTSRPFIIQRSSLRKGNEDENNYKRHLQAIILDSTESEMYSVIS
eukprot:1157900-Pelagomonas_calceolata.AAC.4